MRAKAGANISDPVSALFLNQYTTRMRLKELGFVDSIENVDCITAEAFTVIANEIDRVNDEEMKRKKSRR